MKNYLMKIALAGFLALSMTTSALAQSADEALSVVKESVEVVLSDLRQNRQLYQRDPSALNQLVNNKMLPYFDETKMARLVIGRDNWRKASKKQRRDFINEFKQVMMRTYSSELLDYANAKVIYGKPRLYKKKLVIVDATVINRGNQYNLTLRLNNRTGKWLIIDVLSDGVSAVKMYKDALQPKIAKQGLQAVIDEYKTMNATGAVMSK